MLCCVDGVVLRGGRVQEGKMVVCEGGKEPGSSRNVRLSGLGGGVFSFRGSTCHDFYMQVPSLLPHPIREDIPRRLARRSRPAFCETPCVLSCLG